MAEAASKASNLMGPKLYQGRAREAFPILVEQAWAGEPITYTDLAQELGMPNPRNLDYVLGCLGNALQDLGHEWGEEIPMLQTLVVNKNTRLPGTGIDEFFETKNYANLKSKDRRRLMDAMAADVYEYQHWSEVLVELGLKPARNRFDDDWVSKAKGYSGQSSKGEGEAHKILKEYILRNAHIVGISNIVKFSQSERRLLSGDSVDVYFETSSEKLGIEVKSHLSDKWDIVRGIFQCIKYRSVLEAEESLLDNQKSIETLLVIENSLTPKNRRLANRLGVIVLENIIPS